jgi:hypothetical protein
MKGIGAIMQHSSVAKRSHRLWETAMAKNTDKQPDKKQIEKAIKNAKEACDKLKECNKGLGKISDLVKELDKMAR